MNNYCCDKDDQNLSLFADFLSVIAEVNRLKIICLLKDGKEKCVCELQEFLGLSQNLVSHHLKILRDFGILNNRKQGLNVFYSINDDELKKYISLLKQVMKIGEVR